MCGISGIYNYNNIIPEEETILKINETIIHRGPDNGSIKLIDNVALGHRRLSIIDLSENGNQPFTSIDERYTIVFNGEVYNFFDIREKLIAKGVKFISQSDTEVILYSYQFYGETCFNMFNGMFAIAIYDSLNKELILARDQYGIKPLYYLNNNNNFVFGSEMKAIIKHPDFVSTISNQGLSEYLWFGNPLGNNTIYEDINELEAGSYMIVSNSGLKRKKYFNINTIKQKVITESDAISEIKRLLENSVKRHLISDVPVGVFLSGGIDSSALTAFGSKHYNGKLKTYSVGFDFANGPNELSLAAEIAKKYNTDHHEIYISGNNIVDIIEALVDSHDEPFGDAANIPLYLLTQKVKGNVKVVLQGDGGDEFFGGYSRYNTMYYASKWSSLSFLPNLIELSGTNNSELLRIQRFIAAISEKDPAVRNALLLTMESNFNSPLNIINSKYFDILSSKDPFLRYKEIYKDFPKVIDDVQALFYSDSQIILKDTFFEKVDKSTMANSIEVRVPFVDKELTEFMLSLPSDLKIKNGVKKYLLKKALEGVVPNKILYGKKTGFSVPYAYWLQTSLSAYFIEQISTKNAAEFINQKEVIRMFNYHKKGKGNFGFLLWKTLIFAVWLNKKYNG
ncbi:asparagine synthase (glutamine-hydrolyzing) [Flavobacterium sp.]|jgi:asparagine synthase (glutamine-hydrolysing)|uniref:asparagine synthase (glutamine-hydrolyzing) n=1 Tax=Flavobacterium sp. TaxID=239 RepID=UPI0037BE6EBD